MMKRNVNRILSVLLAALLLFMAACTDAGPAATGEAGEDALSGSATATSIRNKYASQEPYEYMEPLENVPFDEAFVLELGYDPGQVVKELDQFGDTDYREIMNVYIDAAFTIPADIGYEYDDGDRTLEVSPRISARDPRISLDGWDFSNMNGWGYANRYYAVVYRDLETGDVLDKPTVTMFTVEHELESPHAEFVKASDGFATFRWNEIPGAKEYWVVITSKSHPQHGWVIAEVDGTEFTHETTISFEGYESQDTNLFYADIAEGYDFVQVYAVDGDVFSAASNPIPVESFRSHLPYSIDSEMFENPASLEGLGAFVPVQMCDSSTVYYPVTYDLDNVEEMDVTERYGFDETVIALFVPVQVDGTSILYYHFIAEYDMDTLEQDLKNLEERVARAKGSAAGLVDTFTVQVGQILPEAVGGTDGDLSVDGFEVFASSALSEYLAVSMLNGVENIDLSAFNEAFDVDVLLDSFYEASYQNPLVLGIQSLQTVPGTSYLNVGYKQDKEELVAKQGEIQAEVKRVVDAIIQPGMSDLEKEIAINDYLCDTAEYDIAALEEALANNMTVGLEFRDSFTAYGVLINKVGVCASYAAAFKLLADEAGLDSIVVTGYLNGTLPHAWNRVKIDGEWLTVDTTNNDNPELFNALLNLPDHAASLILVEDDRYILDSRLGEFQAQTEELEYYRVSGRYYSKQEIASVLASDLSANGAAALRTDYDLTEEELAQIMAQVISEFSSAGKLEELADVQVGSRLGLVYVGKPGANAAATPQSQGRPETSAPASPAGLSGNLDSFQFMLEDTVYQLPLPYSQMEQNGWILEEDDQGKTLGYGQWDLVRVEKDGVSIRVSIKNHSMDVTPIEQCHIYEISFVHGISERDTPSVTIPCGITLYSGRDAVLAAYGEPTSYDGDTTLDSYYYEFPVDDSMSPPEVSIRYDNEEDHVFSINLINDIAPGSLPDSGAVGESTALDGYQAPSAMGGSWDSYTIRVEGQLYGLPVPVALLLEDGWESDSGTLEQVIPARTTIIGTVSLSMGDKRLGISIYNYADTAQALKDCFVVEFSTSYEPGSLGLELPGGITLDSTREQVDAAYGEPREQSNLDTIVTYTYGEYPNQLTIQFDRQEGTIDLLRYQCQPETLP